MSKLKERFDALVSNFKNASKELKDLDVALKDESKVELEQEVQEINVWSMTIVNDTFAVGDVIKYKDWEDKECTLGSGEFQTKDGRRVVTDATGVVVVIKDAIEPKKVEVPVEPVGLAEEAPEVDADGKPIVKDEPKSIGKDFDDEVKELKEGDYNYVVSVDADGVVSFKKVVEPSEEEIAAKAKEDEAAVKLADESRENEIKLAKDEVKAEYEELLVKLRSEFSDNFVDAPEVAPVKVDLSKMSVTEVKMAEINAKRGR